MTLVFKNIFVIAALLITTLLSGCSLYRPDLRQGDYLTQAELDRLRPDLSKHQVQDIMGTPALTPVFELDQWNYTYAFVDGRHRDQALQFKTISLYFSKDGKLQSYASSYWQPKHLPVARER